MNRLDKASFDASDKIPLTIVLDNVRSMNNVGSVFRTADAFRLERIILCGITATPPHPDIHKTALGAEDSVLWEYHSETLNAVKGLIDEGYIVYALEQAEGSTSLPDFTPEDGRSYALVLGNEVHGVQKLSTSLHTALRYLSTAPSTHSMSASQAVSLFGRW